MEHSPTTLANKLLTENPSAIKPGESVEDFLKRIHKGMEAKTDWLTGAKLVVNYEATNYSRMEEAGKLNEYIYLTAENKRLNLNKEIVQILTENEETLPEEYWDKIIESSKSWN